MMKDAIRLAEQREQEYKDGVKKRNDRIQDFMQRMEKNVVAEANKKQEMVMQTMRKEELKKM